MTSPEIPVRFRGTLRQTIECGTSRVDRCEALRYHGYGSDLIGRPSP